MDPHSSSAGCNHASSSRYHTNLELTNQEWNELHMHLPDAPVFFHRIIIHNFIFFSEPANQPSTSIEVSIFNAKGKSDVWKYF